MLLLLWDMISHEVSIPVVCCPQVEEDSVAVVWYDIAWSIYPCCVLSPGWIGWCCCCGIWYYMKYLSLVYPGWRGWCCCCVVLCEVSIPVVPRLTRMVLLLCSIIWSIYPCCPQVDQDGVVVVAGSGGGRGRRGKGCPGQAVSVTLQETTAVNNN